MTERQRERLARKGWLQVLVDAELYERLADAATKDGRSMSNYAAQAIKEKIERDERRGS